MGQAGRLDPSSKMETFFSSVSPVRCWEMRFRVVRIGTESAEIEELGSGRTRRLPLKTN